MDKVRKGSSFERTPWRGSKYVNLGRITTRSAVLLINLSIAYKHEGERLDIYQNGGVAKGTVVASQVTADALSRRVTPEICVN